MSSPDTQPPGPLQTTLPPTPDGSFFDETQWAVFLSLLDAALPAIVAASDTSDHAQQITVDDEVYMRQVKPASSPLDAWPDSHVLQKFLAQNPSTDPHFVANVQRTLALNAQRDKLGGALSFLA